MRAWTVPALSGLLLATTAIATNVGSVSIPLLDVASLTRTQESVLLAIRLPRIALAILVGAGLGISGAAMQALFRNPLVEPGLLGVSSGAALFAVAAIVAGGQLVHGLPSAVSPWLLPLAAFGGGLAAMLLVKRIATVDGRSAGALLLLAGIAVNALASALTGFFTFGANDAQLRTITFWTLGSLGGATWRTVAAASAFIAAPLLFLVLRAGRALNALLLGEAEAGHLGVDVERTRVAIVVLVAMAVGASVALTGVIAFLGLIVPQLLRLVVGSDNRVILPASALLGASVLLAADAIARVAVAPAELPIGIVTAAVGAPFFVALLVRERRRLA